ncbi:SGNH hydrolase-type esterase domain-containing protein [Hyaloraphidium curvatum]|nr:SGNH hydrolase-type esterase domain-containing protein [Hyaloraphidium curvatum]
MDGKDTHYDKEGKDADSIPASEVALSHGASSPKRGAFYVALAATALVAAGIAALATYLSIKALAAPCPTVPEATKTVTTTQTVFATVTALAAVEHTLPVDPVRIIALGDSITQGYLYGGHYRSFMSYPRRLQERLNLNEFGWGRGFEVKVEAKGGDRVLDEFAQRYRYQLEARAKGGELYEWSIILGGFNDLTYGSKASDVLAGLQRLWDIGRGSNPYMRILQATVMEFGRNITNFAAVEQQRIELNQGIFRAANATRNVFVLDTAQYFQFRNISDDERRARWDDDVHPTSYGYQLLGDVFYEGIRGLLH